MSRKTLSNVNAAWQHDERHHPTGLVELYAVPEWIKSDAFVFIDLTPAEARKLAIDLLKAAEIAGGTE